MKKVLWQILAILVLVGAFGAWWHYSVETTGEPPITIDSPSDDLQDKVGAFVVYQTTKVIDRGPKDWANDDVKQTDIYAHPLAGGKDLLLATVKADESFGGSVWSEVVGQQVLVHRYSATSDALIDLDGTVSLFDNESGTRIANRDGSVWLDYAVDYENSARMVSFNVQNGKQLDNNLNVVHYVLDPAELGIDGPGYGEPFMISDDGQDVYIREICECDGGSFYGFWDFDVTTQTLHKVDYIMQHQIGMTNINPATKQLIGVAMAYNGPEAEFGGPAASPPSTVYLVDLETGEGRSIFASDDYIVGNDFLSPDGTQYASDFGDQVVRIRDIGAKFANSDVTVSGIVMAWIGDNLVVSRDRDVIIYNLTNKTVTILAESVGESYADPDRVVASYAGVIEK